MGLLTRRLAAPEISIGKDRRTNSCRENKSNLAAQRVARPDQREGRGAREHIQLSFNGLPRRSARHALLNGQGVPTVSLRQIRIVTWKTWSSWRDTRVLSARIVCLTEEIGQD